MSRFQSLIGSPFPSILSRIAARLARAFFGISSSALSSIAKSNGKIQLR